MTSVPSSSGSGTEVRRRHAAGWVAAGAALVAAWAGLAFARDHWLSLYDDAYVYFRYVENVFAGCGPRFNCDEPAVEGFTSPLYLLLLLAARLFTRRLEACAEAIGTATVIAAISVTATTALHEKLRGGSTGRWRGAVVCAAVTAALTLDDFVLLNSVIGLETGLAMLAVALVFRAAVTGRPGQLGVLTVVAVLARPECALLVLALPILPSCRSRRFWVPMALAVATIVVVRLAVFGDLAPNTYWAKSGGTARHLELGVSYLGEIARDYPLVVLAPLALADRRLRPAAAYFLVASLSWAAFLLKTGGDTFHYGRLAMPLVPTCVLLSLWGAAHVADRAVRARHRRVALGFPALLAAAVATRASLRHDLAPLHGFPNVTRWKVVGAYLRRHYAGARIATVPIGAIGYFSGTRVVDLVGLTSRAIARAGTSVPPPLLDRKWIGHERHDTAWVLSRKPDVIVMTKWRDRPWTDASEATAGFFAEWLLLRAIKAGRAPYAIASAEVSPGAYWLLFVRRPVGTAR